MSARATPSASEPSAASGAPPLRSISVGLETGGLRGATNPFLAPVFSGGALSLEDLRFAAARLREAREAGDPPLSDTLTFWPAPDPFNHADPAAVWALVREAVSAPAADPPAPPSTPSPPAADTLGLIVDARLNVHAGACWAEQRRDVANLPDDSPATLYQKLSTEAPFPVPPPDAELARRYGDPNCARVHTRLDSVRRKWANAWRTDTK